MAIPETTKRAVHYRRSSISPKPARTLQQLVAAALAKYPVCGNRYEPLNAESTELRVIGAHKKLSGCLCGYLVTFERGAPQAVIGDDPSAMALRLAAVAPPPKRGKVQDQYVPGVLYFAINNNHVAVVQSHSLRGSALETHLNWLLKSRTSEVPAQSSFALSNEAQKATKEKIRKSHVKKISLGQPLMEPVPVNSDSANSARGGFQGRPAKQHRMFKPEGPMVDLLRNFFGEDQDRFEKLGLDGLFDGNVEIWIEIRHPKHSRIRPENSMKLMDTLGVSLRDVEGDQVTLELENGLTVSGADLRVSGTLEVATLSNKLPDEQELWSEMSAWLQRQIENGVIDP